MKINILIFFTIPFVLCNSCNDNGSENKTNSNLLLAQEVSVSCVAIIDNQKTPEWTKDFNRLEFLKTVFNQVISGKTSVYGHAALEDKANWKIFTADEIRKKMAQYVDTFDLNLLKEIRFHEKWKFDGLTQKFSKEVISWVPIKVWEEKGETKKQMIFYADSENGIKGKLVANNIFYEHVWNQEYPNTYTGFDPLNFLKHIISGIKSGEIETYDPIYMIDKSKRKFSPSELEAYIKEDLEPVTLSFSMYSILFEEDWYYDKNTQSLKKEVKSIAFINEQRNSESGEWLKKILFFVFPR